MIHLTAYEQQFREFYRSHPKLQEWLYYGIGDKTAFCKCCKVSIMWKLSHLLDHAGNNDHVLAYSLLTSNQSNTTKQKNYAPAHVYQDGDDAGHEHLMDGSKIKTLSKTPRAGFRYRAREVIDLFLSNLCLSKCLVVLSLAKCHKIDTIAQKTNLDIPIIERILMCEKHIHTIFKYVPNAIRYISPYNLTNIIAITEILKEFISRLMRRNAQITDEELILNAKMLKRVFEVTDITFDKKWAMFFRNNFQPNYNQIQPNSIEKLNKYDFSVQNILKHIKHMLVPAVVTNFNKRLKGFITLSLVCNEMFGKEYVEEDEHDHTESAKTSEQTGCDEKLLNRKIEIDEFMPNINANEMLNDEPQAVSMYIKNEFEEEFIANDDSNEMIEIYAVIDEDEDDNNHNIMLIDEQTDVTIPTVGETQNAMQQEKCIKQEYENPEDTVTKTELTLDKMKLTNITSDNNNAYEIDVVVVSDDDNDGNDDNLINKYETQHKVDLENCRKQENPQTTKVSPLHKCSQEVTLDQIKEEIIKTDLNKNIKEEVFEESHASIQHFSVQPMEFEIKQELDVTYNHTENNESYREKSLMFEKQLVKQSPIQISCIEPEIKQEPIETNVEFSEVENYIDQEIFQEPPAVEYLLQKKYIVSLEHEIKEEPVDNILDPNHSGPRYASTEHENLKTTPLQNLNTEVDDSVQCMEDKIDEAPNETFMSDDIIHSDIAITLKHGAHLTEQRALEIGRIFHSKPYGQLSCETLSLDPIICTYMQILSNQPPLFSETALRKAFQIVLGKELYNCQYHYNIQTEDLVLYRRFVLLVYATKYKMLQLKDIMKHIFSEFEIKTILRNFQHILEEWRTFFNKHFISTLYTKAVYEILFEYRSRYCLITETLNQNTIKTLPKQTTAKDIQKFMQSDFELVQNWQQGYKEYGKKKLNKTPSDLCRMYTINDLSLNCIYEDIKELLPQLVVMYLSHTREENNYLNTNSDNSKGSITIDSLNKNMSMDSNNGKAAFENNKQHRQHITLNTERALNKNVYSKRKNIRDISVYKILIKSTEEPSNKKQKTNQFMPTIVCKNFKDMQSMTTSRESDISTAINLRS